MIYDLDGFWPVRPGTPHDRYNLLWNNLRPDRLPDYVIREIAVCLFTEGWEPPHWSMLMGWNTHLFNYNRKAVEWVMMTYADDAGVLEAAKANGLSVTPEDGLDWLRCLLRRKPNFRGSVPVWTKRALRERREAIGGGTKALEAEFGSNVGHWVADRI